MTLLLWIITLLVATSGAAEAAPVALKRPCDQLRVLLRGWNGCSS